MNTICVKPKDVKRDWLLIDATGVTLGRLAARVSCLLRGKHKRYYSPNIDCGDNVIIINAEKVLLKNKKAESKVYYRHTGHPGGLKETNARKLISDGKADRIVRKAIERMITRNPLGKQQMSKLKVYIGAEHKHEGQNPKIYDFASENPKNQ